MAFHLDSRDIGSRSSSFHHILKLMARLEVVQLLGVFVALPEDLGLVPSTHIVANNHLPLQFHMLCLILSIGTTYTKSLKTKYFLKIV